GGGGGLGRACARHLLRDGATVTIAGRSEDRLAKAAAALRPDVPRGAEVRTAACDVTDAAAVQAAVERAASSGRLDIAVANAGGGAVGSVVRMSPDEWRYTVDLNLTGTFLTVKHAGQAMAGAGGGIVAISSIARALTHRSLSAPFARQPGPGRPRPSTRRPPRP